ncbi:glucosaminidase domain-containing protein [Segatella maculosa]|uniref:glucosaminidase domain-containing protein n=1 Tax=Segatella maculosa TaxID=439703 RepID=UPI0023F09107|nr:glucosaminidase domain-containing protein [Segatella maculosa]
MTKRICLFLFACLFFISHLSAQMRWNSVYQEYIDQYKDLAIEEMLRYNIPASITLAQGIFESGAGRSELSVKGNNHFGIKCHGWAGRSVYHDDDARNECFRAYDNVLQSYEDHSKFLRYNVRYNSLFTLQRTDYRGWAQGLKACGYATNPRYADKLIELIELYKLYELDKATSYDKFMAKRGGYDKPVSQGMSLHPIKIYNKNYYIIARAGDTFKGIGEEIDISYRKIAKYNERDKHDVLHAGEIIYLKKKQKKADKAYKNRPHIVKAGESMYSIAQRYGIRLKSLYKKNHLSPDYQARVGDTLRVY